jgi:hypothetical protein
MKSAGDPTYMIEQYKSRGTENLFISSQIKDFLEKKFKLAIPRSLLRGNPFRFPLWKRGLGGFFKINFFL